MLKLTPCTNNYETQAKDCRVTHIGGYLATPTIRRVNNRRTTRVNYSIGVEARENRWNCLKIVMTK